jgi:putative ABC transport system ATP-binding protein
VPANPPSWALNRLEEPTQGDILLDGHSFRTIPPTELRRRVSLVFQIPMLFPGTVVENLSYGPRLRDIFIVLGDERAALLLAQTAGRSKRERRTPCSRHRNIP